MTEREEFIMGLRQMADFFALNPEIPEPHYYGPYILIGASDVRPIAKRLRTFKKEYEGTDFYMVKHFGPHFIKFWTSRENVCKKIVVGTKEIPEMIIAAKPEQIVPATEAQTIPAHIEEIPVFPAVISRLHLETKKPVSILDRLRRVPVAVRNLWHESGGDDVLENLTTNPRH